MTPAELGLTKEEADLVQTWYAEEVARQEQWLKEAEISWPYPPLVDLPDMSTLWWDDLPVLRQRFAEFRDGGWQRALCTSACIRAQLIEHRKAQEWARMTPEEQADEKARWRATFIAAGYSVP